MSDLPVWVQCVQVAAVVAIPTVGAWLAWRQVQIARVKLHHNLYPARHKVYEVVRDFLSEVFHTGTASDEALKNYIVGTADAAFLCDPEMVKYIDGIRVDGISLNINKLVAHGYPASDEERRKAQKQAAENLQQLAVRIDNLTKQFARYLAYPEVTTFPLWMERLWR
jgi:hypothetical protein